MSNAAPEVNVYLRRLSPTEVLVVVKVEDRDADPAYYNKLLAGEPVGFALDPLDYPDRVGIDNLGVYGGSFIKLDLLEGGFTAHPPRALIDLLLPDGVAEAVYPCEVESGDQDLHFSLPEGGSLLSLFGNAKPPTMVASPCQQGAGCTATPVGT